MKDVKSKRVRKFQAEHGFLPAARSAGGANDPVFAGLGLGDGISSPGCFRPGYTGQAMAGISGEQPKRAEAQE